MTINDLLAPNETVKLSGTVLFGGFQNNAEITLTNLCIYLYYRDNDSYHTIWYDEISMLVRGYYRERYEISIYTSDERCSTRLYVGQNRQWADQIYCAIKHGRDGARNGNSAGTAALRNRTDNPFNF